MNRLREGRFAGKVFALLVLATAGFVVWQAAEIENVLKLAEAEQAREDEQNDPVSAVDKEDTYKIDELDLEVKLPADTEELAHAVEEEENTVVFTFEEFLEESKLDRAELKYDDSCNVSVTVYKDYETVNKFSEKFEFEFNDKLEPQNGDLIKLEDGRYAHLQVADEDCQDKEEGNKTVESLQRLLLHNLDATD